MLKSKPNMMPTVKNVLKREKPPKTFGIGPQVRSNFPIGQFSHERFCQRNKNPSKLLNHRTKMRGVVVIYMV